MMIEKSNNDRLDGLVNIDDVLENEKSNIVLTRIPGLFSVIVILIIIIYIVGCVGCSRGYMIQEFVDSVETKFNSLSLSDKIELFDNKIEFEGNQEVICDEFMTYEIDGRMGIALYHTPDYSGYRVYFNFIGISFGYFSVIPNDVPGAYNQIQNGIACFMVENYGHQGFVSMNSEQVCEMHIVRGNDTEIIEIDSNEPFVQILKYETSIDDVIFYDVNGEIVEYQTYWCTTV